MRFSTIKNISAKQIWLGNLALLAIYILMQTPGSYWLLAISQGNIAKPFNGAMMPLAFVPDWKKADYIDQRAILDYSAVNQGDLVPVPNMTDMKSDFNSMFTYLTVFKGKYMDENRTEGAGSHDGVDIRAPIGTPVFVIGNGKVIEAVDDPNNKFVSVQHNNVRYGGKTGKFVSSYVHLSEVLVKPGDVVDKGTLIGRVGMTGYTTTPHLHIQVDNEDAPFYPYWPFSIQEAQDAGYSFYEGVDAGLNMDLIDKYSVDPIDFIKNAKGLENSYTESVAVISEQSHESAQVTPTSHTEPLVPAGSFVDVPYYHPYRNSIMYLSDRLIVKGYPGQLFKVDQPVTRSELLSIVFGALKIPAQGEVPRGVFRDLPNNHWVSPFVAEAIKRKVITTNRKVFEPNRAVTRIEFMAILGLASEEKISNGITKSWRDLPWSHWSHKYAQFGLKYNLLDNISGFNFKPVAPVTRGEVAEAVYRYLRATNRQ